MPKTIKSIKADGEHLLAFDHTPGSVDTGVIFCGGFNSSRNGQKALALQAMCERKNISYTRFDYSGHGDSEGEFKDGSIDSWLADTLCVFDHVSDSQKNIIIGSSMGAWIAVLTALARTDRIAALITIAAAPDFTERLLKQRLTHEQHVQLDKKGCVLIPSEYDDGSPYPISKKLIADSRQHCVLNKKLQLNMPVRMLHGTKDNDVPYQLSVELLDSFTHSDATLTLVKDGDHRLSDEHHLTLLEKTLSDLLPGQ